MHLCRAVTAVECADMYLVSTLHVFWPVNRDLQCALYRIDTYFKGLCE